jgi:drug/metabolite transporter (DMT)-like permease
MSRTAAATRIPTAALGVAFVLLWCTGYPAAKIALGHFAPFTLLLARFGGAGLMYAGLALLAGAAWPRGRAAVHSAVVGSLSLALQFGALYLAVVLGVNVGMIALVIGTMPIVTALLGLGFGEVVRPLQWLGFAFGFSGVALAVGEGIGPAHGAGLGAYLAVLCGLLAVSFGTLYQKRFGSDVDMRTGLAVQHLVAAALVLPLAAYEGFRFDASAASFASLGWVIAINSMSAFGLLFVLLKRGAVNQVAALFFLMPPVTALIDYVVLGDRLTLLKVAGIVVAAFGVYLATRPQPARSPGRTAAATAAPIMRPATARRGISARPAAIRRSSPALCE